MVKESLLATSSMGAEGDTTAGVSDAGVAGGVEVAGEDVVGLVDLLSGAWLLAIAV